MTPATRAAVSAYSCRESVGSRLSVGEAPVAPAGVLLGESEDLLSKFRVDRRASTSLGGWLTPVSGNEAAMPADHGGGIDDEEHFGDALAVEHPSEPCEHEFRESGGAGSRLRRRYRADVENPQNQGADKPPTPTRSAPTRAFPSATAQRDPQRRSRRTSGRSVCVGASPMRLAR